MHSLLQSPQSMLCPPGTRGSCCCSQLPHCLSSAQRRTAPPLPSPPHSMCLPCTRRMPAGPWCSGECLPRSSCTRTGPQRRRRCPASTRAPPARPRDSMCRLHTRRTLSVRCPAGGCRARSSRTQVRRSSWCMSQHCTVSAPPSPPRMPSQQGTHRTPSLRRSRQSGPPRTASPLGSPARDTCCRGGTPRTP